MKTHKVLILDIDKDIEEEALVEINGIKVFCFISYMPIEIFKGNKYEVEMELVILGDYQIKETNQTSKELERIEDGFAYWVRGYLSDGVIDCGIEFEDEYLLANYGHLDKKFIEIKTDRIDLSFIRPSKINGKLQNECINNPPHDYHPNAGLASPTKPRRN